MRDAMKRKSWHIVLVVCTAMLLGGCTLSNSLRPQPVDSVWRSDAAATRAVFFATDREPVGASFSLHWGAALRCGRTDVTLPAIALPGQNQAVEMASCDDATSLARFARRIQGAARAGNCNS